MLAPCADIPREISTAPKFRTRLSTEKNCLFRELASRLNAGAMTVELPSECQYLISRQGGVLACSQAVEYGLDPEWLKSRLRYGDWQRLQRGVYAAYTGRPSRDSELWAALLRCGNDAVLSHYTAAERHGLLKGQSQSIHVAVPKRIDPARCRKIA